MEMGSPNGLMRQGWSRNSMKIGDEVTRRRQRGEGRQQHRQRPLGHADGTAQRLFAASEPGTDHAISFESRGHGECGTR
mgnify:CR=1 FL=1